MQKRGKAAGGASLSAKSLELREPSGRETAGKPAEQQQKRKSEKGPEARKGGPGPEDEGQRGDERAEALSTKNSTRRMKAGRTGAEAQRRRQNGSARGEKKGREEREGRGLKKGKGGEDRKKRREKERAESGGLSRELA